MTRSRLKFWFGHQCKLVHTSMYINGRGVAPAWMLPLPLAWPRLLRLLVVVLCSGQWLQFPQHYDKSPRGMCKRTAGNVDGRKDATIWSDTCRPTRRVEPKNTFTVLNIVFSFCFLLFAYEFVVVAFEIYICLLKKSRLWLGLDVGSQIVITFMIYICICIYTYLNIQTYVFATTYICFLFFVFVFALAIA